MVTLSYSVTTIVISNETIKTHTSSLRLPLVCGEWGLLQLLDGLEATASDCEDRDDPKGLSARHT